MIMIKKTEDDEKVYVYHLNGTPLRIRTETTTGLSRFPLPVGIEEHINDGLYRYHQTVATPKGLEPSITGETIRRICRCATEPYTRP